MKWRKKAYESRPESTKEGKKCITDKWELEQGRRPGP